MSNTTYESVIPAALGTVAWVQRVADEPDQAHTVVAWASVNGGPVEALVDVNDTGVLTPISELRRKSENVSTSHPDEDA